jgi:S-adenosylmethionine:tRNA ribosyltransferase-isomerase
VAVGTTVVRTLETVVDEEGLVHEGEGWTETVVTPDRPVRAVDGLLTGWHEPRASHLLILQAIAEPFALESAYHEALEHGYLWHELGDLHLILPARPVDSSAGA